MKTTKISARFFNGCGFLPVGIAEFARAIHETHPELRFALLEFDGIFNRESAWEYGATVREIQSTDNGLRLEFAQLVDFLSSLDDVFDLLLVGQVSVEGAGCHGSFEVLAESSEVCVEIFDSTTIEIAAKDGALAERLGRILQSYGLIFEGKSAESSIESDLQ